MIFGSESPVIGVQNVSTYVGALPVDTSPGLSVTLEFLQTNNVSGKLVIVKLH